MLYALFLTLSIQADKTIDAETLYLSNGCPSCHGFYAQGTNAGPRLQTTYQNRDYIDYGEHADGGS